MSDSSIFVKFKCAQRFAKYISSPSYHPKNKDVVIISTHWLESNKKGIYEYNTKQNTFNKIYTYDQTFKPDGHGQFIDSKNELLYIFGGDNATFGVFDLNIKVMNTDTESALSNCDECPQATYIPSPTNEYHILSNNSIHYVMDMNNKNINKMEIHKLKNNHTKCPKLLYIPFKQQLMAFGSHNSDKIWRCNIKQISNEQRHKGQLYHLKMPHSAGIDSFDILLAFDNIIFIFYFVKNSYHDIWCIDLLNNKLIKTKYNTPKFSEYDQNIYVMKDSNNNGHIINFKSGEKYTFNLHNLIPKEVIKLHREHYSPLIIGYIKQEETKNDFSGNIPNALKELILYYFPLFI
eukprot:225160_1